MLGRRLVRFASSAVRAGEAFAESAESASSAGSARQASSAASSAAPSSTASSSAAASAASSAAASASASSAASEKVASEKAAKEKAGAAARARAAAEIQRIQSLIDSSEFMSAAGAVLALPQDGLTNDSLRKLGYQHNQLVQHYTALSPSEAAPALNTLYQLHAKLLALGRPNERVCAQVMLLALRKGEPEKAIELWVQLLEALSLRQRKPLRELVSQPGFAPAALAALAAYFASCSRRAVAIDPETALKLIPLKQVPVSLAPLAALRGLDSSTIDLLKDGLKQLRSHVTDYNSAEYRNVVAKARFNDINSLYQEAMDAAAKGELPEESEALFIRRFAETRQVDRAFQAWNTLVNRLKQEGKAPSVVAWRALIRAGSLAPVNSEQIVNGLWQRMSDAGIQPDADCWCVRLETLVRSGKADEAARLYKSLLDPTNPQHVDLGVYGLNIVVTGLARSRKFDQAEALFEQAEKPNTVTFNALINAAVRRNQPKRALEYVARMRAAGVVPDCVTYSQVMHSLFRLSQRDGRDVSATVSALLKEMRTNKIQPNTQFYTILADGIAKSTHSVDLPRKIFRAMEESGIPPSVETFGALIDAEIKHGDFARAVALFKLLPKYGLPYSAASYNQLIAGALQFGNFAFASSLFKKMRSSGNRTRPNIYTYMFLLSASPQDIETNSDLRAIVTQGLEALAGEPTFEMDYPLAVRVKTLGEFLDADAVLIEKATAAMEKNYDPSRGARGQ